MQSKAVIRPRLMRYFVCLELQAAREPMSVAELVTKFEASPYKVIGRTQGHLRLDPLGTPSWVRTQERRLTGRVIAARDAATRRRGARSPARFCRYDTAGRVGAASLPGR
jgi:hypothetical protein